jgi:hypothetical protein
MNDKMPNSNGPKRKLQSGEPSRRHYPVRPGALVKAELKLSLELGEKGKEELMQKCRTRSSERIRSITWPEWVQPAAEQQRKSGLFNRKPMVLEFPFTGFRLAPSALGGATPAPATTWERTVHPAKLTIAVEVLSGKGIGVQLMLDKGAKDWDFILKRGTEILQGQPDAEGRRLFPGVTESDLPRICIYLEPKG